MSVPGLEISRPGHNIQFYMGDWDSAMRSALVAEFPDIHLYGCLFHYAQCLRRKACSPEVRLAREIGNPGDPEVTKIFLAFTALPLLPAAEIVPAFKYFAAVATTIHPNSIPFVSYMRSQWIESHIGPMGLSLYRLHTRTNNAVESNNALFARSVKAHGHTWDLMAAVVAFSQDIYTDSCAFDDGHRHIRSTPASTTRANERAVNDAWDKLASGELDPAQFINLVKYRVGGAAQKRGLPSTPGAPEPIDPDLNVVLNPVAADQ